MINRYFVVDDFYNDPDRLVEAALKAQRDATSRGNYAGVMTKESFLSNTQRDFFEQLLQQKPINASTELNGKIRFSKADDSFHSIHPLRCRANALVGRCVSLERASKGRWHGILETLANRFRRNTPYLRRRPCGRFHDQRESERILRGRRHRRIAVGKDLSLSPTNTIDWFSFVLGCSIHPASILATP